MTDSSLRWGIAATGRIAAEFAADLAHVGGCELVAVASRSPERAGEFAARFDAPRFHGSYEALAADPDVDVVYVATPQTSHCRNTTMFLDAGKHVLCEKPLAVNAGQAAEMIEAARRAGRFLMEAVWSRFLPPYVALRELLDAGSIGAPELVDADFGFRAPFDPDHRLFSRELGGGSVLDLGIYPLQLATTVLGPATSAVAAGLVGSTGVDESAFAVVTHAGGGHSVTGHSVIRVSLRMPLSGTARIIGTAGTIELPAPMHHPDHLLVTVDGVSRRIDTPFVGHGLHYEAAEAQRCIGAGALESAVMPWAESVQLAALMDSIRASIGVRYEADG